MRKFHQILGLVMLLPFIAWAITGTYFFFKPGYQEAYQSLIVKRYPMTEQTGVPVGQWLEVKQLKSILGYHSIVKNNNGWQHYLKINEHDELSQHWQRIEAPTEKQVAALVHDAIDANSARYGKINALDNTEVTTTTGVTITLNWRQLSLRQQGQDTAFINTMYNIHYLRWTGNKAIDQYLGVIGLVLVLVLAGIGTWMTISKKRTV